MEPDFAYIAQLSPLPSATSSAPLSSKRVTAVPQISTAMAQAAAPSVAYSPAPFALALYAQIRQSSARAQQDFDARGGSASPFGDANLESFAHPGQQSMLTGSFDQPQTQGII